jgi:hypothetical protein
MMTIGKRNFMDSSKAKRRGSGQPGNERPPRTAPKNKKRIFAENQQFGGTIL